MPTKRILLSAIFNQQSPFDSMVSEKWYGGTKLSEVKAEGQKILVLWGGEDISPSLYGQKPNSRVHITNYSGGPLPYRDQAEKLLAEYAIKHNIPIIGVCRGAQMMCALAGGKLVQHVDGHHGDHTIMTKDDKTLVTSSIHHQMMLLEDVEHELIAWTNPKRSTTYLGEEDKQIDSCHNSAFKEPEIVWIPSVKALCIQGHPEYMSETHPFVKYVKGLVEQYIYPHTQT